MKTLKKSLSLLLALVLCFSTCILQQNIIGYAVSDNADDLKVLLIEDDLPWDSTANTTVLNEIDVDFKKIKTNELSNENLWNYDMIVVANDQSYSTYNNFKQFKEQIDLFANFGGIVIYGACDAGWANGIIQTDLPGGVKKVKNYCYYNHIVDSEHPIVTASLSDGNGISDFDLHEFYCSHNDFVESSLPDNCNIILKSDSGAPTLIEYPLGSGYVIASALTWEYNYVQGNYTEYAKKVMDDLFLYGLSLCNGLSPAKADKMKIKVDNNSFVHSSDSFFGRNESQTYLISDEMFNKLNTYYEENFYEWLPFTKNQLQKARVSKWGGSCFGISATMALAFTNGIELSDYVNFGDKDAVYFNAPAPRNNQEFRSLINYYQLAQYLPLIDKKSVVAYTDDSVQYSKELQTIVELAKQSEKSGIPYIFTFGYSWKSYDSEKEKWINDSAGHAIVCIGMENLNGKYRLQFVDPNSNLKYVYANVDKNYSKIEFESIYTASQEKNNGREDWKITRVGHDTLSSFDAIKINNSNGMGGRSMRARGYNINNDIDIILFDSHAAFKLTAGNGDTLLFDGAHISGTMEILDIQYYEKNDSVDIQVAVASNESYIIENERQDLNLSIYNSNNNYYAFDGSNANEITINMSYGIVAKGNAMNCNVYFGGINGKNTDMICFSNPETNMLKAVDDGNSIVLSGDNIQKTTSTGFSDVQTYDIVANGSDGISCFYGKDNEIKASLYVRTPSTNTIKHGETLMLYADADNLPKNTSIVWYADNKKVDIETSNNGMTCAVKGIANGSTQVVVMAVDEEGNVVKIDDCELLFKQDINVKSNLLLRIIAFIKNLFKIDMIIDG